MRSLFSRTPLGSLGLGALFLAVTAVPAQAHIIASVNTSQCTTSELSQPFLAEGDTNLYAPLGGESYDNFTGQGWQLSGGAKVVTTTLKDGSTGEVLDLPNGSKAVSPVICVTSEYPTARAQMRNLKGAEGALFFVEYEGTRTWESPKVTGLLHAGREAWTLVAPVNMAPENRPGEQPVRITLVPGGRCSEVQLYNLYIDPRMR